MKEAQRAAFSFEGFKIPAFQYRESEIPSEQLSILLDPHGIFNPIEGQFQLQLLFKGFHGDDPEKNVVIVVDLLAHFKFESPIRFDEIPPFFYPNAIAIVFPYLRAFISTLTLQANTKLVKLPLLNLSDLVETFKNQTKVISDS